MHLVLLGESLTTSAMQILPEQIKAGRGTNIFTGATASLRGGPKFAMLACPKFALRALAQSAAREFQSKASSCASACSCFH